MTTLLYSTNDVDLKARKKSYPKDLRWGAVAGAIRLTTTGKGPWSVWHASSYTTAKYQTAVSWRPVGILMPVSLTGWAGETVPDLAQAV